MAATQARIGLGTKVFVTRAAEGSVKTELGEIKDITWPSATADEIDVSHMGSPGGIKEYIQGMKDLGEVAIPMNWIPGSATDTLLEEITASGERVTLEFLLKGDTEGESFLAFSKGYSKEAPVNEALTAEITFRIVGIVESAGV